MGAADVIEVVAALDDGRLPNLVGWDLNRLGDETGLHYWIHDEIGVQTTKSVASDVVSAGSVVAQWPEAGTPLTDVSDGWVLESNHGGDFKMCSCGRSFVDGGDEIPRVPETRCPSCWMMSVSRLRENPRMPTAESEHRGDQ